MKAFVNGRIGDDESNVIWEFEEYKDWHNERLEVLPGVTGLAQVRGRSGITFDSIVKYDIEYDRVTLGVSAPGVEFATR